MILSNSGAAKKKISVFSLSMSVVSLPRPYLPEFGSHAFCLTVWFLNHISSVLLLQGTAMRMYKPCQITTMAYETWACKFRIPNIHLLS